MERKRTINYNNGVNKDVNVKREREGEREGGRKCLRDREEKKKKYIFSILKMC